MFVSCVVSGVLKNKVKFNLGDVYLNQSAFTLHADEGEASDPWGHAFAAQRNLVATRIFFKEIVGDCKGPKPMPRLKETVGLIMWSWMAMSRAHADRVNFRIDLLAGPSVGGIDHRARGSKGWSGELHHAVLADLPYSGTVEHNVLNPVTHGLLHKQPQMNGASMRFTAEGGWSNHSWRIRDMMSGEVTGLSD